MKNQETDTAIIGLLEVGQVVLECNVDGWAACLGQEALHQTARMPFPMSAIYALTDALSNETRAVLLPPAILLSNTATQWLDRALAAWALDTGERPVLRITGTVDIWVASLWLSGTELVGPKMQSTHLCCLLERVQQEIRMLGYWTPQDEQAMATLAGQESLCLN